MYDENDLLCAKKKEQRAPHPIFRACNFVHVITNHKRFSRTMIAERSRIVNFFSAGDRGAEPGPGRRKRPDRRERTLPAGVFSAAGTQAQ